MGKWVFEVKQVFARKTDKFGNDFTASMVITSSGKSAKVELAISKDSDNFTREDYKDLHKFLSSMGFEDVTFDRIKNGKVKKVVRKV